MGCSEMSKVQESKHRLGRKTGHSKREKNLPVCFQNHYVMVFFCISVCVSDCIQWIPAGLM
jgi:hypothetical protein